MSDNEFSHIVKLHQITGQPVIFEANKTELGALARRFGLSAIHRLKAAIALSAEGGVVAAQGRLLADIVQSCAVSGKDFAVHIDEPLNFRFAPESHAPEDAEIDLSIEDCDEIWYSGESFDLGEATAQGLGLAIDPFARGPDADEFRQQAGLADESAAGPFSALAALKKL